MMNPLDIFFGVIQIIVAAILLVNMDKIGLPNFILYFLAVMIVISAIWDFFD